MLSVNRSASAPPAFDHSRSAAAVSWSSAVKVATAVVPSSTVKVAALVISGVAALASVAPPPESDHAPIPSSFVARTCTWWDVFSDRPDSVAVSVVEVEFVADSCKPAGSWSRPYRTTLSVASSVRHLMMTLDGVSLCR